MNLFPSITTGCLTRRTSDAGARPTLGGPGHWCSTSNIRGEWTNRPTKNPSLCPRTCATHSKKQGIRRARPQLRRHRRWGTREGRVVFPGS